MADFREIHVTLSDGYEAYARYWPVEGCTSAVLYLHGIQSHCGWYTETARAINEAGFAVLQPDRRGSGRNQQDRGHAESAQQLIDDGMVCARKLGELAGLQNVHILGVSWGGKLAAAIHATEPSATASLKLVAPGLFPIVDVSAADKFRIGLSMLSNPTRMYDIPLNDPELFTDKPDRIRFLIEDPYQLHRATAGFFLASRRVDRIWSRIRQTPAVPLLVFLAGVERIIDNDKTRKFVRDLSWPCRHITAYERSRHTIEFGDDRNEYAGDLIRWLRDPQLY